MPVKVGKSTSVSRTRPIRDSRVRKEFWLNPSLLRLAQKNLGATTERETVEMVTFRRELGASAQALRKLNLSRID